MAKKTYEWMKKIHMYAGLLTFTAFVVWGFTGIHAIFLPAPGEWQPPEVSSEQTIVFEAPGNLDDKQLAQLIYDTAALPMSGGYYGVQRDDNANLVFISYGPNGPRDFTYLENEKKIHIKFRRGDLGSFISDMHTAHSRRGARDLSARLWGLYNEFSTWAFLFMVLSGVYLWIASRPGLPWARWLLAAATLVFVLVWITAR